MMDIFIDLAKNDWDCYQFTKMYLRQHDYKTYSNSRDFFRWLNRKYGPKDEYFDVA